MASVVTAHKYRFYPTIQQEELLAKTFGCCRYIFNYFLDVKVRAWKDEKKSISYKECSLQLKDLKSKNEWLKEVSSVCLQQSLRNLDRAFQNFFGGKHGFPAFKKRSGTQSAHFMKNAFKISGNQVFLAKSKTPLNIKFSRPLSGEPSSLTVTKEACGRYYISFCMNKEVSQLPSSTQNTGIDVGISSFITDNEGKHLGSPKFLERGMKSLRRLQKRLSRKKKTSSNRKKAIKVLARKHAKIRNRRHDFLHKLSRQLVFENQVISVESLSVKKMMKHKGLARKIADCGWNLFLRFLEYKCEWYGRILVKIDQYFPSSKTCSSCGSINKNLELKDRAWKCACCGSLHDRDHNAAKNILCEGLRLLKCTVGLTES